MAASPSLLIAQTSQTSAPQQLAPRHAAPQQWATQQTLVPVPVQSVQPQRAAAPAQISNPNLRWRRSGRATLQTSNQSAQTAATNQLRTMHHRPASTPAGYAANASGVAQASYVAPAQNAPGSQNQTTEDRTDFFRDPFGDQPSSTLVQTGAPANQPRANQTPGMTVPPGVEMVAPPMAEPFRATSPVAIQNQPPANDLRNDAQEGTLFDLPAPATNPPTQQNQPGDLTAPVDQAPPANNATPGQLFQMPAEQAAPTPPPAQDTNDSDRFGEMLREQQPDTQVVPQQPAAGADTQDNQIPDPPPAFPRDRAADEADRERLQTSPDGTYVDQGIGSLGSLQTAGRAADFSCEDFRARIAAQTIDLVSLDVSPPFRPDEFDQGRYERLKSEFLERQSIRQWRDRNGEPMAVGRLIDLAYEKAVIETEDGSVERLPINRISEGDIAYITDNWGLPKECLVEQVAFTPRQWAPITMTWTASNLCHTPLYFQDVNLERYGHTHGPVLEPFVQSAQFFGTVFVLPYKMGVHLPNQCQYTLGYYRPGNCAPWIKPPVPISARGAIAQAATMTGMFWLIP